MPIVHDEADDSKTPLLKSKQKSPENTNTRETFDYEDFIQRMKHPSCRPYLIQIRRFISDFDSFPASEQSTVFHRFHQRVWEKLLQLEPWQGASASEGVNAREGLEYLLMNQLYEKAYRNAKQDMQADREILLNIRAFSWLELSHLQSQFSDKIIVPSIYGNPQFRTPKDKLDALIRGCRKLKDLSGPEDELNADELLPILIVAMVKSQPEFLTSELSYIQKFRDAQQLRSADAYLFTHCLATAQFIRNLNINELSFKNPEEASAKEALVKEYIHKMQAEERQKEPASAYSRTSSLEFSRIEEKATKVFGAVRQSHAVKSIKKFFGEAEIAIREGLESLDQALNTTNSEEEEHDIGAEKRENELRMEEEFQMQLAMALSLSEQDLLTIPEFSKAEFCESWICTKDFA